MINIKIKKLAENNNHFCLIFSRNAFQKTCQVLLRTSTSLNAGLNIKIAR